MIIKHDVIVTRHGIRFKLRAPAAATVGDVVEVLSQLKNLNLGTDHRITANFHGRTIRVHPTQELSTFLQDGEPIEIHICYPFENIEFINEDDEINHVPTKP